MGAAINFDPARVTQEFTMTYLIYYPGALIAMVGTTLSACLLIC